MQKITLHPQARTEMFNSAIYYDDCRDGLGTEFLEELESTFSLIKSRSVRIASIRKTLASWVSHGKQGT